MLIYLDENIPSSAIESLSARGHSVHPILDFVHSGTPDQAVAAVSQRNGAVLITHDNDFREFASRRPDGQLPRYPTLSVIQMRCKETRVASRLEQAFSLIELEYAERLKMRDQRLIAEIHTDMVTIHR